MIDQNELRIGNWVSIDKQDWLDLHKYIEVNSIYKNGINAYYDCADESTLPEKYCSEISGIELTPEILQMVGFEKTYDHQFAWHKKISKDFNHYIKLFIHENDNACTFELELSSYHGDETFFGQDINSLHQLQNLIFALTGEELTYTP